MKIVKQICSAALSAGLLLSSVMSVAAAEEGTISASSEEAIESVASEENIASEYEAGSTGLVDYGKNVWRYQVNGVVQWNYTGLVEYYGTWYYVENGVLNWGYTGLTNYYGTWYYVENGRLKWSYTGLTNYYGTWYYVENGVLKWGYTGLTNYYGTWYYVENGVLNWSCTSLINYYGTWYYVEGGVLNWKYTGLAKYYDTWYYIDHGVLNWNYTGFAEYYGTRYHVKNGVLDLNYSGFDLQAISAATDKFALSPYIAWYILQMYGHGQAEYDSVRSAWDGARTSWGFIIGRGARCATTVDLDLTTGLGEIWWDSADEDSQYEGSVNFINKTSSGEKYTFGYDFFDYYIPDNIYVTRGFTWKEMGSKSAIDPMTNELGKSCIEGSVSMFGKIGKVEYIGNTGKGRIVLSLTDISGKPFGYAVADPVYNYFAVYDMNCVFIGEGRIDP